MHISPLEEYGLRCAAQLAKTHPSGQIAASRVAELEGLSTEYASKILFLFKKAGLIKATRGARGGFKLSKDPTEIPLKDVFAALQQKKQFEGDFCNQFRGKKTECVHVSDCSIRPIWKILYTYLDTLFTNLTVADLIRPEGVATQKTIEIALPMPMEKSDETQDFA